MSAERVPTVVGLRDDGNVDCWCCDTIDAPDQMFHLGNHPEVHLCLPCAHFVHQRAGEIEDQGEQGPAVAARDRRLRVGVIRRGWHQNRVIRAKLRWVGKYFP